MIVEETIEFINTRAVYVAAQNILKRNQVLIAGLV
jgi:hypothetical protein